MRDGENPGLIGLSDTRPICLVNITWLMLVQHKLIYFVSYVKAKQMAGSAFPTYVV